MAKAKSPPKPKSQANKYDKITKESLLKGVPRILEVCAGLKIRKTSPLKVELQHTREMKADFLGFAEDESGRKFILHIEFQAKNDPEMIYRMLEYRAMLRRLYPEVPISQFVIFFGENAPTMQTELTEPDLAYRYHLIWTQDVSFTHFINSDVPEEILWSVFADFGMANLKDVAFQIVEKIHEKSHSTLEFQRHIQQLRILSNIRNLHPIIEDIMESISRFFVEERDPLFKKGIEKGIEKGILLGEMRGEERGEIAGMTKATLEIVFKLILESDHDDKFIGRIAGIETKTVEEIRDTIKEHPDDFRERLKKIKILPD